MRFFDPIPLIALAAALLASPAALATGIARISVTALVPDIPHVMSGEVAFILGPRLSLGISGGGFAYTFPTTPNPTPISISAFNARARWFPFQGTFFIGIIAGYQAVGAGQSSTFTIADPNNNAQTLSIAASAKASINSPYLTPHIGWFVVGKSGFTWGFELGVQVPFHSTSSIDVSTTDPQFSPLLSLVKATAPYQKLQTDIQNVGDKLGNIPLPYTAFRMGWTF